jgi:3-hydroxyisobutyrate dehydrogenase
MQIGIAGVGRMGAAIGARLMDLGHSLTVWNRSSAKTRSLVDAGAAVAGTPRALVDGVDVVITILTDASAIEGVYDGPNGLLAGDPRGKLFIDMSTVRPETEIALAARVRAKGAAFVECPVGGSTGVARDGKLIGLMGAEPTDAERASPLLKSLCRRLEHVGPVGAGSTLKFSINLPLMIYWQALGEALSLCRPLGLDPLRLMDLFADTSGGANVLKVRGAMIAAGLARNDFSSVGFDVDSARKDLRAMLAEAKARNIELPLAARTLVSFDEVSEKGWGARDASSLAVYWSNARVG